MTLNIKPKEGFGELNFADSAEKVIEVLGTPEEVERLEDDDSCNTVVMNYWNEGISIFFEGIDRSVLSCFETENHDALLFGQKVFELNQSGVLQLMKDNGFELTEEEVEDEGEKRLTFDEAMLDFFFEEDDLCLVNWGVLVNEHGEIGSL